MELEKLLAELEAFGAKNDRRYDEYSRRMMNIPRETGQFLQVLVMAARARRILEIGTSNGYSTLWLARAARGVGGRVTTVERLDFQVCPGAGQFRAFRDDGCDHPGASQWRGLSGPRPDASFDFIFLDSERSAYPAWWQDVKRILTPGGLWVADNALSHPNEFKPFVTLVEADPQFTTCVVPVGNGEYVAVKTLEPPGKGESATG